MNFAKVVFGFFVILAASLDFGLFIDDIDHQSATTSMSASPRSSAT